MAKQKRVSKKVKQALADLSPRDQKFLALKSADPKLSDRKAALLAGYPESVANIAGDRIRKKKKVAKAFQMLMQEICPAEKIATRIAEGLDAMETKTFSYVTGSKLKNTEKHHLEHVDYVNFTERRQYAELAAKFGGLVDSKGQQPTIHNHGPAQFIIDL